MKKYNDSMKGKSKEIREELISLFFFKFKEKEKFHAT